MTFPFVSTSRNTIAGEYSARSEYYAFLALALIYLFHLATSVVIVSFDRAPPLHDEFDHLRNSLRWLNFLTASWPHELSLAQCMRELPLRYPPLVYLTTVPFLLVFGLTPDAAVWSMLPYLALLLHAVYRLGRRFHSPRAGVLAAALLSFYPFTIGFSRVYFLELPTTALVLTAFNVLLDTKGFTDSRASRWLGVILALSCWAKWTAWIFFIGPLMHQLIIGLRGRQRRALTLYNFFITITVLGLLVLPCYLFLLAPTAGYLNLVVAPSSLSDVGARFCHFLCRYLLYLPELQLLAINVALLVLALPMFFLLYPALRWCLTAVLAPPLCFFAALSALGFFDDARFTFPLLPSFALITSLALVAAAERPKDWRMRSVARGVIYFFLLASGLQTSRLCFDENFQPELIKGCIVQHGHGGRYRPAFSSWPGEVIVERLGPACLRSVIQPLFTTPQLIDQLTFHAMYSCTSMIIQLQLSYLAGGFARATDYPEEVLERDFAKTTHVLRKTSGFLGVEDVRTDAPLIYPRLLALFERHQSRFELTDSYDLPDGSILELWEHKP